MRVKQTACGGVKYIQISGRDGYHCNKLLGTKYGVR